MNGDQIANVDWEVAVPQQSRQRRSRRCARSSTRHNASVWEIGVFLRFTKVAASSWLANAAEGGSFRLGETAMYIEMPVIEPVAFPANWMAWYEAPYKEVAETLVRDYDGRIHLGKNKRWLFQLERTEGTYGTNVTSFNAALVVRSASTHALRERLRGATSGSCSPRAGLEVLHAEAPRASVQTRSTARPARRASAREAVERVLVRVLGADGLARREVDACAAEVHDLLASADEVHLDAAARSSIQNARWRKPARSKSAPSSRFMRASRLRLNAAVTPRGVVVGALEHARVLREVDADQEARRPGRRARATPASSATRLGRPRSCRSSSPGSRRRAAPRAGAARQREGRREVGAHRQRSSSCG